MKNTLKLLTIVLAGLTMFSCNSKNIPDVTGSWTSHTKYKTELPADLNDPQGPDCGEMFTVQEENLELTADLTFTTRLSSKVESIYFTDKKPDYFNEEEVKAAVESDFSITGTYVLKDKYIEFLPEEVNTLDGQTVLFEDFLQVNPNAASIAGRKQYLFSEDKNTFTIGETKYSRAEK